MKVPPVVKVVEASVSGKFFIQLHQNVALGLSSPDSGTRTEAANRLETDGTRSLVDLGEDPHVHTRIRKESLGHHSDDIVRLGVESHGLTYDSRIAAGETCRADSRGVYARDGTYAVDDVRNIGDVISAVIGHRHVPPAPGVSLQRRHREAFARGERREPTGPAIEKG